MEPTNLDNKTPNEILQILSTLFESSREQKDLEKLTTSIEVANLITVDKFNLQQKATYNYFLGNAWSYIQQLKNPTNNFELESEEIEKQITYFRIALSYLKEINDDFLSCQVLTNLGNLFSHIGRVVEAQEYFNLCLRINPEFGMAIGNRGFGLFHYARIIFDPIHQFIFMQHARKDLLNSCELADVYNDAKEAFKAIAKQIESAYPIEELNDFKTYRNYFEGIDQNEIDYRKWCAENKLFINPLNDVLNESIVANDNLFTPSMVLKVDEKPVYQSMFNQLKQEYISARYLFYESLISSEIHFSDKNVTLMDTLDYAVYSLSLEKTKIAFRISYSLFDKIAYFLNIYFGLSNASNKVSFRNIWYKNLYKNQGLNSTISSSNNWALRGLYWLSKDLFEKEFHETIEPEAKEIATIRNYIEHKSFKVVDSFNPDWSKESETYEIDRNLFEGKTFKILKLGRSALMYLTYLIHEEENHRSKKRNEGTVVPVDFINLKDDYKL